MALPQAIDILNYLHLIFLHVREFHRTLSEVVSSLTADHSFIQSPQERHLEEHSATQPLLSILRIVPHLVYATQTYIRQNHVILNIAQIQHHPTFIGISCSLYISFIQANTQFVSASTMYAMQSNANSCMPSAPLARSGSPPRCCKHLPSYISANSTPELVLSILRTVRADCGRSLRTVDGVRTGMRTRMRTVDGVLCHATVHVGLCLEKDVVAC